LLAVVGGNQKGVVDISVAEVPAEYRLAHDLEMINGLLHRHLQAVFV
jgi:hypothetical protein